jgi:tRNA nucleotidyltransferase (CCA-adding enzyme)
MQLITTHINADFDGLASMVAASKLYPGAVMAFPGSQERNVREFITENLQYEYAFSRPGQIDITKIRTLIVVDTKAADRLGAFADCLDNPELEIHLYDHHPGNPGDLKGAVEIEKNFGSTTTLLINILRKRNIPFSRKDATLFALGIYEDTGSLTHLTTTPADLIAAAYLVEKGAELDQVSQFITHELKSDHIDILQQLQKNARQYTIQDIPIVIVTHSLPEYVDEFAPIVRRFMTMENIDVLFALISMGGRIYLIARSRMADVNVGIIARDMGGGGHPTAASATLKDITLIQAQEKLIHTLHRHILPQPIAREMMSQPAISVPPDTPISTVKEILTRYNINSMPVCAESQHSAKPLSSLTGIITRQVLEKATHHHLADRPVSDYMSTEVATLPFDATLADIQELIIEHHQRLIPIVENEFIIGVITRTDLLNRLVNDPAHLPKDLLHESDHPSLERKRNVNRLIVDCLEKKMIQLLQIIGNVAEEMGFGAFAVGGFVRDLLLKKQNLDLDIVIEGDGILFAKKLADKLNGRHRTHKRFNTATVILTDGFKIDIATARLEYYEYPAAMPTVELSSIKLDLYRRDFTINAMAIQLNPHHFGTLIDFFNCQNDLKQRTIKVLHNLSFVEDPSRIFRAIRFEKRMDFLLSPHTKRLIVNAVDMKLFGKKHDPRYFNEIKIILSEENPLPAIERLAQFNLFPFLWPDLRPHLKTDRRFRHILTQAHNAISWFRLLYLDEKCRNWMVYLLAIFGRSGRRELEACCLRFQESPKITEFLLQEKAMADRAINQLARSAKLPNSQIAAFLEDIHIEGLLYIMALARKNHVKKAVSLYVTNLRDIEPELTGKDLVNLGYTPGPQFKTILERLRNFRIDGLAESREDELVLLREHFPL